MAEYIEREALVEELEEEIDFNTSMYTEEQNKYFNMGLKCALRDVRHQPAADVQKVRHGEWVQSDADGEWGCSLCHGEIVVDAYGDIHPLDDCGWIGCPYCLARMDGKGDTNA